MEPSEDPCDCGLDFSAIINKTPIINIKCLHDGTVGLSLYNEESYITVVPGQNIEVRWRVTYPKEGGPPTLSRIGWNDEDRQAGEVDRDRTDAGITSGAGTSEDPFAAFADEGAGSGLAPDGFIPLIGYRAWVATRDDLLKSTAHATVWSPNGSEVASCQQYRDGHHVSFDLFKLRQELDKVPEEQRPAIQANIDRAIMDAKRSPERNCMCGIYAVSELKDLGDRVRQMSGLVHGRIKAWGKIATYTKGFRAEYAKVDALYLPKNWLKRYKVRRIAKNYGVPVEEFPEGTITPKEKNVLPTATVVLFWIGFVAVGAFGFGTGGIVGYAISTASYALSTMVIGVIQERIKRR